MVVLWSWLRGVWGVVCCGGCKENRSGMFRAGWLERGGAGNVSGRYVVQWDRSGYEESECTSSVNLWWSSAQGLERMPRSADGEVMLFTYKTSPPWMKPNDNARW